MVDACPSCDSPKITERVTKTPRYRCNVCRERFAEPVRRASQNHTYGTDQDTVDEVQYQALVTALRRTRAAGSSHARSKLIAKYSDELNTQQVAQLLTRWAEPRGDVQRYREASLGIVWRITVAETGESEVPA